MKQRKIEGKDSRVWTDTGKRVEGKKLFRSIVGNYAIEIDGMDLVTYDRKLGEEVESHVD